MEAWPLHWQVRHSGKFLQILLIFYLFLIQLNLILAVDAPKSGLALVALSAGDAPFPALALARLLVAGVREGAHRIAVTRRAAGGPEPESADGAAVTAENMRELVALF
jgi:hypothetical protein